ncbi:MAG: hypothetical protein ACK4IB_11480, partial [Erythrobacter sp.]
MFAPSNAGRWTFVRLGFRGISRGARSRFAAAARPGAAVKGNLLPVPASEIGPFIVLTLFDHLPPDRAGAG